MPLSKYFGGKGEEVMESMRGTYKDAEKAERVFYATAAKQKQRPQDSKGKKRGYEAAKRK